MKCKGTYQPQLIKLTRGVFTNVLHNTTTFRPLQHRRKLVIGTSQNANKLLDIGMGYGIQNDSFAELLKGGISVLPSQARTFSLLTFFSSALLPLNVFTTTACPLCRPSLISPEPPDLRGGLGLERSISSLIAITSGTQARFTTSPLKASRNASFSCAWSFQ